MNLLAIDPMLSTLFVVIALLQQLDTKRSHNNSQ